jgi:hypothetical protein
VKIFGFELRDRTVLTCALVLSTAVVYFFSNPEPRNYYDYTFRVAGRMLSGHISLAEKPPPYLNEFVPFEGGWYSVFPLGAVVTMFPFAALAALGLITEMPAAAIYAVLAGSSCLIMLLIARRYDVSLSKQILLTMAILFGTFAWTNLTIGGAWQLALGFAMVGELGAIWFTVFDRRPVLAGAFFALAFGNRTEILLAAPVLMYLLNRLKTEPRIERAVKRKVKQKRGKPKPESTRSETRTSSVDLTAVAEFCAIPFLLGVATLAYNYIRFHSMTDFGYARIPGVLSEPWYSHGIFSTYYIPRQAWEMLFRLWETRSQFPYLLPNEFSSSIIFSSPFLLFAFRRGSRDRALKFFAWVTVIAMTLVLWMHGNSGGWQFGYRYAMVLLPWLFVIILESTPKKITPLEWAVYSFSFIANTYATWLFHWSDYLR